jgi:hypothetical protein
MRILTEGLNHMDMEDQITPLLGIDEFKSRIGNDSDIIVLNFIVGCEAAGNDLVDWLERGYEWIVDSEVSPGEVLDKKYFVYAEINRRTSAPKRIVEIIEDLKTLCGLEIDDWQFKVDGEKYPLTLENLQMHLTLDPIEYKNNSEDALNEWRQIAGLPSVKAYEKDPEILALQRIAKVI